jgi:hypothetical protein
MTNPQGAMRLAAVGSVLCALLAGCATQERTGAASGIAVATAALTEAQAGDANRYASSTLQSARESLAVAAAAMTDHDYHRARLFAQQAETDATLASARSNSAKAQAAANELTESTRLLRSELGRTAQ